MNQNGRRAFFYGMGGAYLIYLAYMMFKEQSKISGMEPGVLVATVILFGIVGAALIVFAIYVAKKESDKEKNNQAKNESETD